MSVVKVAAQELHCEDYHQEQQLNNYTVAVGEKVILLSGNGHYTKVISSHQVSDLLIASNDFGEYPEDQVQAARHRLDRVCRGEQVYGPLFRD